MHKHFPSLDCNSIPSYTLEEAQLLLSFYQLSHYRPGHALRARRKWKLPKFIDNRHMKIQSSPALRNGRLCPREDVTNTHFRFSVTKHSFAPCAWAFCSYAQAIPIHSFALISCLQLSRCSHAVTSQRTDLITTQISVSWCTLCRRLSCLTSLDTFPPQKVRIKNQRLFFSGLTWKYAVRSSCISEPARSKVVILRYLHKHPFKESLLPNSQTLVRHSLQMCRKLQQ